MSVHQASFTPHLRVKWGSGSQADGVSARTLEKWGFGVQADGAFVRTLEVGNTFAFPSCAGSVCEDLGGGNTFAFPSCDDERDGTVVPAARFSD